MARLRKFLFVLSCAIALTLMLFAPAQAQTYVRPSKGAGFISLQIASIPAGVTTATSAVYDMSAFVGLQLDATLTQATATPTTKTQSWSVGRLGRYVRVVAIYDNSLAANSPTGVNYNVETADAPTGPFMPIVGGNAYETIVGDPAQLLTSAKLTATPLPYDTTKYTRPAKGNSMLIYKGTLTGGALPNSYFIDMSTYAGVTISVTSTGSAVTCRYGMAVIVYGGPSASGNLSDYSVVNVRNGIRTVRTATDYAVPVAHRYALVDLNSYDYGAAGTTDCSSAIYTVVVTPIPYEPNNEAYAATTGRTSIISLPGDPSGTGPDVRISAVVSYRPHTILQNPYTVGSGNLIDCSFDNGGQHSILLRESEKFELAGYGGDLYCRARDTSTVQLFVVSY